MARQAPRGGAAEQMTAKSGICVFQIIRDGPGIGDPAIAIDAGPELSCCPMARSPAFSVKRHGMVSTGSLLCARAKPDAPAIGTEAAIRIGAGKIVETKCHAVPHSGARVHRARAAAPSDRKESFSIPR